MQGETPFAHGGREGSIITRVCLFLPEASDAHQQDTHKEYPLCVKASFGPSATGIPRRVHRRETGMT
jgi:hypothetical protein